MEEESSRTSRSTTPTFDDIRNDASDEEQDQDDQEEENEGQDDDGDENDDDGENEATEETESKSMDVVSENKSSIPSSQHNSSTASAPISNQFPATSSLVPLEFLGIEAMSQNLTTKQKRERTNAKPVECLDMDGTLIQVYGSGALASKALNIQQGDISLCCRGLKKSTMGYRFRFFGDIEDKTTKAKKGFGYVLEGETNAKPEVTRSTRASRGEYGQQVAKVVVIEKQQQSLLAPKEIKVC